MKALGTIYTAIVSQTHTTHTLQLQVCTAESHDVPDLREAPSRPSGGPGLLYPCTHPPQTTAAGGVPNGTGGKGDPTNPAGMAVSLSHTLTLFLIHLCSCPG